VSNGYRYDFDFDEWLILRVGITIEGEICWEDMSVLDRCKFRLGRDWEFRNMPGNPRLLDEFSDLIWTERTVVIRTFWFGIITKEEFEKQYKNRYLLSFDNCRSIVGETFRGEAVSVRFNLGDGDS
jgi:hypothetical protein